MMPGEAITQLVVSVGQVMVGVWLELVTSLTSPH